MFQEILGLMPNKGHCELTIHRESIENKIDHWFLNQLRELEKTNGLFYTVQTAYYTWLGLCSAEVEWYIVKDVLETIAFQYYAH